MKLHQIANRIVRTDGAAVAEIFHNSDAADLIERYNAYEELVNWVQASAHKRFCARFSSKDISNTSQKCGCGRDELLAQVCGDSHAA